MGLLNVIISPKALSQLDSYINYLQYTLLNDRPPTMYGRMLWKHGSCFQELPAA